MAVDGGSKKKGLKQNKKGNIMCLIGMHYLVTKQYF